MNPILVLALRLILVLLSYTFVGWIGYSIYLDLRQGSFGLVKTTLPPITLEATLENEIQTKRFTTAEVSLGRDPSCDFPLSDETISQVHCRLTYHHKQWWAEDLNSTNGSYLNATQLESPVVLTEGDELRLGQIYVTIRFN